MEKSKMKISGISLIVLIVTIIIIIILSGVLILSLNNADMIVKAKLAKESSDFSSIREMLEMEKSNELLTGVFDKNKVIIPDSYKSDIEVTPGGTVLLKYNETTKILNIQNAIDNLGAVYIPKGFEVSSTSGEMSKEKGLVIKDITAGATFGNEFVWIPVENYSEFYRVSLFTTFEEQTNSNYKSYNPNAITTEKEEYDLMKWSVIKYNGFYIARYEAGKIAGTNPPPDGSIKPLSKPNIAVWNNIAWDEKYVSGLGIDTNNGVVKVARSMYPVESAGAEGYPVSTLTYGEEWDMAMRHLRDTLNRDVLGKKYIIDSTKMGVYGVSTPADTGSNPAYAVKNIYDMAGNVFEWTMEAVGVSRRAIRGGDYNDIGSDSPASMRDSFGPVARVDYIGFRSALYIK